MNKQHTKLATLVEDLEVQKDFLAEENASFANYLGDCGYTKADIDLIAQGWHGSIEQRLVENERQEIRIKDLEASLKKWLKTHANMKLKLAMRIQGLEKSLKDREKRLNSIMGLANDCNYED